MIPFVAIWRVVKTLIGIEKTVEEVIEVTFVALDPEPHQPGQPLTHKAIEHQRAQERASIAAGKAASQAASAAPAAAPPSSPGPSSRDTPTPPAVPRLMPPRRRSGTP